ncbi:RNA polymerase-associated protein RapA [Pseudoalteromonas sp. CIP111854]|uniref:RNA polymerase-associated protein RapA n=1 Tax=Pseudoalteromonas holothuriae TaxID=2963714 RepID=A0A9W4R1C4_9GAMM|nr:DEAD/DEAH box helicase [Pseudoalteromonas sp. CIP111854]CAH9062592.1 RNA polymerase-associated protein RapA [Pseudoalteromonas sp. CIP111854]
MSTQLSKEQLFALFEEIKQEQASQFPLSERFLKQYFNAQMLSKAKEYLNDSQISFLEHNNDFSKIDAQIIGNQGNTFSQHISMVHKNNTIRVNAQCTCSSNNKCRHIAAVLLKLKIEHSGGFGEAYLVNDWFNELEQLQSPKLSEANNVLLFSLEMHGSELLLAPKVSPLKPDGVYPLGRALTEHQLTSQLPPAGVLDDDFRLFTWVRSQNSPGHYELNGAWGHTALQQLLQTNRLYFQTNRTPLAAAHQQSLQFVWQQNSKLVQLKAELSNTEQWVLIKTDPPYYLDTEKMLIGPINSELNSHEIAHLLTMPTVPAEQLEQVYQRFAQLFCADVIEPPKGVASNIARNTLSSRLRAFDTVDGVRFELNLDDVIKLSKKDLAKQHKRCEQILSGMGLVSKDKLFSLPVDNEQAYHWFNNEVRPQLLSKGWGVDELVTNVPVVEPIVSLLLRRDKQHHILGKVQFDDKTVLLDWDTKPRAALNELANKYQYIKIADQSYAIDYEVFSKLLNLKFRFSYYLSNSQFKFPLYFAKELFALNNIAINCDDSRLIDYLDELKNPPLSPSVIPASTSQAFTLRDYQEQGVNWLKFLNRHQLGGILADDMGLGKTLQVIAYFITQHNILVNRPSLIVCPTSLVGNWQSEFARFAPHLTLTTVHGSNREAYLCELPSAKFILTTYPLLKRDIAHYKGLEFDSIVLDEAQYIKNESAQISKCVKQLKAQFKLCLSGTPVENNLLELKSLLDFVMPDILGTRQQFKQYFQYPIEKEQNRERARELHAVIAPFILRRTKAQVVKELPDKTELIKELEFSAGQAQLYRNVQDQVENSLLNLFKEQGVQRSKLMFLDALLKLRQICCHPVLVDSQNQASSAKLDWLEKHLPVMLEQGRKVIIFSQFTTVLDLIAQQCDQQQLPFSMLTGQTRQRDKVISEFTQGKHNVFLISLKAGGTGLNLTQADTVIHFDPWWNPAVENQATDRAYRIGQDKPVFVYKLIMANSIEQKVFNMQQQKQALVDALFEDKAMNLSQFDEEQMLSLLR